MIPSSAATAVSAVARNLFSEQRSSSIAISCFWELAAVVTFCHWKGMMQRVLYAVP